VKCELPPWLRPEPPEPDPSVQAQLRELDSTPDSISFVCGRRSMGWIGHLLSETNTPSLFIRLDGCRTLADTVLQLGWAINAQSPGSPVSVGATLAAMGELTIAIDARTSAPELVTALYGSISTLAVSCTWMVATLEEQSDQVQVITANAAAPVPNEIPIDVELAAVLPDSQRMAIPLEAIYQSTDAPSGCVAPHIVHQIRRHPRHSNAALCEHMVEKHQDLLSIATGSMVNEIESPMDLYGLRFIAEHSSDSNFSCFAAAAEARLRNSLGQPTEAFERIAQNLSQNLLADPAHRALVAWADAQVHLDLGDIHRAEQRFKDATQLVHMSRDLSLLATMHRRWADTLTTRLELTHAIENYQIARALFRRRGDIEGMAATLRGSADLAVAAGETISAEALYDQAEMTTTSDIEQANRHLGWAGLFTAKGQLTRAKTFIEKAARVGARCTLITANCARRKADISIRSGDPITAAIEAESARSFYAQHGHHAAAGRCMRILGDAASLQGHTEEATSHYRRALNAQIRVGDMNGLQRTISHIVALEEELGDLDKAKAFRQIAARLNHTQIVR
jgi:tetratricopeptide (TPR) repeat protein